MNKNTIYKYNSKINLFEKNNKFKIKNNIRIYGNTVISYNINNILHHNQFIDIYHL